MTFHEWQPQWGRLAHFRISADADRDQLEVEWFAQLKHWHVDAVDAGITLLIGHAKDNFLPGLGLLKDHIQSRVGRYEKTRGTCATCNGTTWIEAMPWKSNGWIYSGFTRCPDCGVPAPTYTPYGRREELTATEYQQVLAGTFQEPAMPLSKPNRLAAEALQLINPKRGRMVRAITGAAEERDGAA